MMVFINLLVFLIKLISYVTKKSREKFNYFENKKRFEGEMKSIFDYF